MLWGMTRFSPRLDPCQPICPASTHFCRFNVRSPCPPTSCDMDERTIPDRHSLGRGAIYERLRPHRPPEVGQHRLRSQCLGDTQNERLELRLPARHGDRPRSRAPAFDDHAPDGQHAFARTPPARPATGSPRPAHTRCWAAMSTSALSGRGRHPLDLRKASKRRPRHPTARFLDVLLGTRAVYPQVAGSGCCSSVSGRRPPLQDLCALAASPRPAPPAR